MGSLTINMNATLKKTLDMAAAGGVTYQEVVDKVLQDLIERNNPIRQNLPRKKGSGPSWILIQRTAASVASWVNDIEEPASSESTYERKSFDYKTLLQRGKVSRKLQTIGRSWADIKAMEMEAALETIKKSEENTLIWGDSGVNAKQFDGFDAQIPSEQAIDLGVNGGPLTLEAMDKAIDLCYGKPDMIIASKRTRRELQALLQGQQRFVDMIEVKGGFKLLSYNGIPIYVSPEIPDDQTKGTATNASSLYVVDTTKSWIGELTPLTVKDISTTSSQFEQFDLFEDLALVFANPKYHAKIVGIIPPV